MSISFNSIAPPPTIIRILFSVSLLAFIGPACTQKRAKAPSKADCKQGEIKDSNTGKCNAVAPPAEDRYREGIPQADSSNPFDPSSGANRTKPSSDSPDISRGDNDPSPIRDHDGDGQLDTGKDEDGDGHFDAPSPTANGGRDIGTADAQALENRQNGLRYTQYPPGFSPDDGWDISGGTTAPGFSSAFASANSSFGAVKIPLAMWIGRDHQNSLGAIVAFARFPDPNAATNINFLYRRKAYEAQSLAVDSYGRFAGSLAIDVQVMFDFKSANGALKCKTPAVQLDGRYLAIDPQSMAPRETLTIDAMCGKQ